MPSLLQHLPRKDALPGGYFDSSTKAALGSFGEMIGWIDSGGGSRVAKWPIFHGSKSRWGWRWRQQQLLYLKLRLSSKTSVPHMHFGYTYAVIAPSGKEPEVHLAGSLRESKSYCKATSTANQAKAVIPVVPRYGFTPAILLMRKYDFVRSNRGDM